MARLANLFPLPDLWSSFDQWFDRTSIPAWAESTSAAYPAFNVLEQGDRVMLEAELPGMSGDDVNVSVVGQDVMIGGERKAPVIEGASWTRRERPFGAFNRTVTLPWEIAPDSVEATLRDGVLTVSLAKSERCRTKRISIQTA